MKNFWKKHSSKTLEEYLIECIHESTDFCLNFKEIPNPDFVTRFRSQYEREFEKLANLQSLNGKNHNDSDDGMDGRAVGKQSASTMATLSRQGSSSNMRDLIDQAMRGGKGKTSQ